MMRFVYTAWFRNPRFPSDDQDHEWPACFLIDAVEADRARIWGDHLSSRYATRSIEEFLWSKVEPAEPSDPSIHALPLTVAGDEASGEGVL
jgi:hypothetical protein